MANEAIIDLTVLAPAHNEAENVEELVRQIESAMAPTGMDYEILIVDDGSTDATRSILVRMMPEHPRLRCVAMKDTPAGKGNGQSAAFHAGIRAARGRVIAFLDADLQNDPAEIPAMLALMERERADMVQGDRSGDRKDNVVRRAGSIVGRLFRRWLLGDSIRDTGCSLRVVKREYALRLPLEFKGMHRFIPVGSRHVGAKVVEMAVRHRPRVAGTTKYGMGVLNRGIPGLLDLLAVRWMRARRRPVGCVEIRPEGSATVRVASRSATESRA